MPVKYAAADDLPVVRELFLEYARSLDGGAHMSLHHQGFEKELEQLPGRYVEPRGCILLACVDDRPAGCAALREIPPLVGEVGPMCEMKRMYVRPAFRGQGLGRELAVELLAFAVRVGYRAMKLDTEPTFLEALGLYRSLGFREIPRYNDDPVPCTMFMGVELG